MQQADVCPAHEMRALPAVEFEIPACPQSRNRYDQHWAQRQREDARWRTLMDLHAPKGVRFEGPVVVTLTFFASRPCDPDNVCRAVLNAMKDRYYTLAHKRRTLFKQLLPDDGPQVIVELRLRSRKGEPRTVVRIEEAT